MFKSIVFLIVIILVFRTNVYGQKQFYTISKHYEETEDSEGITDSIHFYANATNKKLFSFCKKLIWGDCNSMGYEWGKYETRGDTIVLYSLYAHQGGGNSQPFGVRKMMYTIKKNEATQIENKIFLKRQRTTGVDEWIDGVDYVLNLPKTTKEKTALKKYVDAMTKEYGGSFLLHEDAKKLLKEVHLKFTSLIKAKKKEWDKESAPFNRYKI